MIYIDGLGYVNQTNQTINNSNTSTDAVSAFDNILHSFAATFSLV